MKSPVLYGNPVAFGPVDWNYAAGASLRRGKSVDELGDAGWARERERMAHLQQMQHLHQLQLQQQQVGFAGYGIVPPGQPQNPVLVAGPSPVCPVPVHDGMMVHLNGPVPPPAHVAAPWPVHLENQVRHGHISHQPSWEYADQHKAAFTDVRPQGQDVYFHPRSEDGHLDLKISEWKGRHCFYQGPEDYNQQEYNAVPEVKNSNDFRAQEGKLNEDRRGRDGWDTENEHHSKGFDHRNRRDVEDYDYRDKYRYRDHYDRKYTEQYDDRDRKHYDSRKYRKHDLRQHETYHSEHEDYYDRKDAYSRDCWDSDHYDDRARDFYDSKDSHRSREKDSYRRREEDRYYDERKHKDYQTEDWYDHRDNNYKQKDKSYRRVEDTRMLKGRGQYDSEVDEHWDYRDKDYSYRYSDSREDRRDERYNTKRRDYKTREQDEQRAVDDYDFKYEDHCESRKEEHSHHRPRERYRDLRSTSIDSRYEEYPKKDRMTHCEEWVEQQNQKLALREVHSFEDPVVYQHSDEQEKGYESSAGSVSSKRGRKPVYVGSLDRNSFYRKTAPSSLRKSQFGTTRKRNQGKHMDIVM